MVALAVVTTIALCLLLDWLSNRDRHTEPAVRLPARSHEPGLDPPVLVGDIQVQLDMSYHPAHSWALAVGPDRVRVGVDAFVVHVLGPFDAVDLPRPGARVVQGAPAWGLCRGTLCAPVLSPVSGRVVAVNSLVAVQPHVLQEDAYGAGWLLEVETEDVVTNLNNLLHGVVVCRWLAEATGRSRRHLGPARGGSAPAVLPESWSLAVREFLCTEVGSVAATHAAGDGG
ncbi:MAG: glycine cleavage system protein H [bacterium]|nr:glycine cleavage system protein H [bacterium]